jgi:hypothetical protein
MATAASRAVQRAIALQRLTETVNELAKAHKVDAPNVPTHHKDPSHLPTVQMEAMADFLEALAIADPKVTSRSAAKKTTPKRKSRAKKTTSTTPAPEVETTPAPDITPDAQVDVSDEDA